ncbi:MAG: hypothetical protein ACI97K_000486 [Glaciecola sp.]|jgi:hypothetical protein
MSLKIHVFIATNKGLVALQNMIDLNDSALQSVITIKGSTDIASISPAYHRFVQKTTGLIQKEFGGNSFRTNISRNIDQGSSWQLSFYIAHFIDSFTRSSFQLGNGVLQTGDIALIATGQVNTSSGLIEPVNHIPEKYISASAQIKLWMKKGILVEFFIPLNNQSGQLSELDCVIYPVMNTEQVREHVEQLLPIELSPDGHETAKKSTEILGESAKLAAQKNIKEAPNFAVLERAGVRRLNASGLSILSAIVGFLSPLKVRMLFVMICFAVITIVLLSSENLIEDDEAHITRFAVTKKSNAYCDTNAVLQVTPIAEQYVTRAPSIRLHDACSLTLITPRSVPQIWLVADTKALIELEHKLIEGESHWNIPIPTQQHYDREYILILTHEYLDLADLAAFKTKLSGLNKMQRPSIELLAEFFTQIDVNPQYISQKLVAINQ